MHEKAVEDARCLLRKGTLEDGSRPDTEGLLRLAEDLGDLRAYGYARRIVGRRLNDKKSPEPGTERYHALRRRYAYYLMVDPDVPPEFRLQRAFEILTHDQDRWHGGWGATRDVEALWLAGCVSEARWELESQETHLERAVGFYLRAAMAQEGPPGPYVTGPCAATALEALAQHETDALGHAGGNPDAFVADRVASAEGWRREVDEQMTTFLDTGPPMGDAAWWAHVFRAQARAGLGNYEDADEDMRHAQEIAAGPRVRPWQKRMVARQVAGLARLRRLQGRPEEAERVAKLLDVLAPGDPEPHAIAHASLEGKLGLALSGGGFRAALFHIGVLAKLADLGVLRRVEVISCVSGGSIVGAAYYLGLQDLLQHKRDEDLRDQDYVDLVERLASHFARMVKRNLRAHVALNPLESFRIATSPNHSRTRRVADLLDRWYYAGAEHHFGTSDSEARPDRRLNDLLVTPAGFSEDRAFSPRTDNVDRTAKVPVLLLNGTTLNTGNSWQFAATWMGEPGSGVDSETGGSGKLRRMHYADAPADGRPPRLADAVAASACVPGIFEPLTLPGIFEALEDPSESGDSPTGRGPDLLLQLVDGGVHDNQGIAGLLDQECTEMIVSDACGQIDLDPFPGETPGRVLRRANKILQARVREEQYRRLEERVRTGVLDRFAYMHLKKGLGTRTLNWVACPDPYTRHDDVRPDGDHADDLATAHGMSKAVQSRLASVRTDLDAFHETEAYALMTCGYLMAGREIPRQLGVTPSERASWPFVAIQQQVQARDPDPRVLRRLDVSRHVGFKPLRAFPIIPYGLAVAATFLLLALASRGYRLLFGATDVWYTVGWLLGILLLGTGLVAWVGIGVVGVSHGRWQLARAANRLRTWARRRRKGLKRSASGPNPKPPVEWFVGLTLLLVGFPWALAQFLVLDRAYLWWGKIPSAPTASRGVSRSRDRRHPGRTA